MNIEAVRVKWVNVLLFTALDTQILITSAESEKNWKSKESNESHEGLSTHEGRDSNTTLLNSDDKFTYTQAWLLTHLNSFVCLFVFPG